MKIGIVSLQKNVAPWLLEWTLYHRMIGVSEILLYDDQSTDETPSLARSMEALGLLRYERVSWQPSEADSRPLQEQCLSKGFEIALEEKFDWLAHIDDDEFIDPVNQFSLADLLESAPSDAGAILMQWAFFSFGAPPDGRLLLERCQKRPLTYQQNEVFKSIFRPQAVRIINGVHRPLIKDGWQYYSDLVRPFENGEPSCGNTPPRSVEFIRCCHYRGRSDEEAARQAQRNSTFPARAALQDSHAKKHREWPETLREICRASGEVRDRWAERFLPRLKLLTDSALNNGQ